MGITLVAFLQAGLAPIAAVLLQIWVALGAALLPLFQVCRLPGRGCRQTKLTSGHGLGCTHHVCACPGMAAFSRSWLHSPPSQFRQGVQYTTAGPLLWVGQSCGAAWTFLREAGAGLAAGSAALVGTAKAGRAVGGATGHALAEQASRGKWWLRLASVGFVSLTAAAGELGGMPVGCAPGLPCWSAHVLYAAPAAAVIPS